MRIPSDAEFLGLWESGQRRHPLDRALLVLGAAWPETSYESLADWPLGRRNRCLGKLYLRCFGPQLRAWTACPVCGEKLEFEMNTQSFTGASAAGESEPEAAVAVNGWTFRLPSSRDVARAAGEADPWQGAVRIVESCLLGTPPPPRWSEEELSAIGEKLAAADPLAELRLTLHCPDCENDWEESLDPAAFFWTGIEGRVRQIFVAVTTLAAAYGWSEADILAMSETRRTRYLELAQT